MGEAAPVVEHVTSRDGTRIGFHRSGEGPPLVLLHGATGAHWSFRYIPPGARRALHALRRRPPGAGGERRRGRLRPRARVRGRGGDRGLARRAGERVRPLLRRDRRARRRARNAEHREARPVRGLAGDLSRARRVPGADRAAGRGRGGEEALVYARGEEAYTLDPDRFEDVAAPALLLLGGESPDWAREGTERIRDALPDARIAVLPGEGHAAIMAAPELVADTVTRFLAE